MYAAGAMATPRSCFVQALLDTPSPLPHLTRHGDGAGGHVTDVRSTARPRDAPPARPSARGTLSLYKKPKLVVVVPYRVRLDTSSTLTPHHRRTREHAMHVYRQSPAPAHMPRRTPRAGHSGDALYCCVGSGGVGSVGLHLVLHLLQLLLRSHLGGLGGVSGGRGRRRLGLTEQAAERA